MTSSSDTGSAQFGVIGLAVMGWNLALNVEDHGFPVAVWNRDAENTERFVAEHKGRNVFGAGTLREFVKLLDRPRRILMMVKAGEAVDQIIQNLVPLLDREDVLVDGGNSWFEDTRRRGSKMETHGISFVGMGVSGGGRGARLGPSLMPGGGWKAYEVLMPVLESIAANTDSGPCVTHVGPDGAGHFVKMVHNGIEYGDMQLIAEAYDILKRSLDLKAEDLANIFAQWNLGPLESFLIEITSRILAVVDEETGRPLVDLILDKAGQKGTGRWALQVALDLAVPVPTIAAALDARVLSGMKAHREKASRTIEARVAGKAPGGRDELITAVHDALLASKICAYAQGMDLIRVASQRYQWDINLKEMARIWRGGCIIRAKLLDTIMRAYDRSADLTNLLLDDELGARIGEAQPGWRRAVEAAQALGIPVPAMGTSLAYFDSYRTAWLPQNLIQAQRDAFGSHMYERADRPEDGFVHTDWLGQGDRERAKGRKGETAKDPEP